MATTQTDVTKWTKYLPDGISGGLRREQMALEELDAEIVAQEKRLAALKMQRKAKAAALLAGIKGQWSAEEIAKAQELAA